MHIDLRGGGYTPHYMDECQNKGDRKWAIHKCMKIKGRLEFGDLGADRYVLECPAKASGMQKTHLKVGRLRNGWHPLPPVFCKCCI
jgi:hypothetical protein